jgi:hypothetical protein
MSYSPLMAVDLQGYSAVEAAFQDKVQAGLRDTLRLAAERAGLEWDPTGHQPRGDGVLAVLAPGTSMELLVDRFIRELKAAVREHNRLCADDARLRMRVALHHGPAQSAALGYSGDGPVTVTRLCDSGPLRAALQESGLELGAIVSETVFRGTVKAGRTSLDPADLRQVRLPELDENAWFWIPGYPGLHGLKLDDSVSRPRPTEGPPPDHGGGLGTTINAGTYINRDQNNFNGWPR